MLLTLRSGLVAAAGFAVAMGAFALASLRLAETNEMVEHGTIAKLAIVQMRLDAALADDNATNYALTGRQERLRMYRDACASFGGNLARVRDLTRHNPVQQAAIDGIETRMQSRFAEFQAVVDIRDAQGKEAALTLADRQIGLRTSEIRAAILGMLAEEDRLMLERHESAKRLQIASVLAIAAASACFAFLFVAGWNARRAETQSRLVNDATRAKLEAENAALNERAKVAEFQERFIGVLGHDLRNPLGALAMGIDLLRREVPSEQRTLERMASSARRMSRMIDQLLDLTRARLGGGIQLKPVDADLAKITSEIVDELRAQSQNVVVHVTSEGDLRGEWDADRLAQVISNLVGNAIHHGSADRPIDVELEGDQNAVSFCVRNHGAPITETLQKVLFDPFRRGERESNSQKTQGVGLGLYISREIIERHGGRIDVSSSAESGTAFTFTLPRTSQPRGKLDASAKVT